jgi:hypothetical protein
MYAFVDVHEIAFVDVIFKSGKYHRPYGLLAQY